MESQVLMYGFSASLLLLLYFKIRIVATVSESVEGPLHCDVLIHIPSLLFNGQCLGCHRFDGIGGISGGGATSRLLMEYDPDVQNEILDFLFLPNFGASLHMLKVEIGGDAQSTDGSESTHMHSPDDLNVHRGYEWWMLKEAKKRNPNLLTYGLPWAFPGWVTNVPQNPFKNLTLITNYTLQWVIGAREAHGIEIDYLGIWNEIGTNREYLLSLRKVLDDNGFSNIKIVSNDGQPQDIIHTLANDSEYLDKVDILGFHYPRDNDRLSFDLANTLGRSIWASEESSSYDDMNGAACWARVIASHFVHNNMTANIMWNLVGSYYHGTNWYASSMLTAVQPWAGYYEWESMPVLWATAHYTQFIQPGWLFLPVGSGSGELASGGYYVTLTSPDYKFFTTIVVKISRDHASCTRPALWDWNTTAESFHLTLKMPFSEKEKGSGIDSLQVWYSNLEQEQIHLFENILSRGETDLARTTTTIDPTSWMKSYNITLNVSIGSIFSVTNQMGVGKKGASRKHRESNATFPLPYHDNFREYRCDNCYARYLADQQGAFELQSVALDHDASNPRVLVQMTPEIPIMWWQEQRDRGPVSVIGMTEWEDIAVEVSFLLPNTMAAVCVATRTDSFWARGLSFCSNSSMWYLVYGGANLTGFDSSADNAIAYGAHDLIWNQWHNISLATLKDHAVCAIDSVVLDSSLIRVGDSGFAAIGVNTYAPVQFGHLTILPLGNAWSILSQEPQSPNIDPHPPNWSLSLEYCTPNGLSNDSEKFELTSNWQILHMVSRLCVTAESTSDLSLQECSHDFTPQQFRHQYTLIRNGGEWPLSNVMGDLCGTTSGGVFLARGNRCGDDATDRYFASWAFYPNTHQLRNSFGYRPWLEGARSMCLRANPTPIGATQK